MGGNHHCSSLGRRLLEHARDRPRIVAIDRCERLICEDHLRTGGERSRDGDPLPLSRRELARIRIFAMTDAKSLEGRCGLFRDLFRWVVRVIDSETENDVFQGGQPREQALLLEDERDLSPYAVEVVPPPAMESAALHPDLSRRGAELAVQQAEQCGLARAARPGDLDQLASRDREVDLVDDPAAPEGLVDGGQPYQRAGRRRMSGYRLIGRLATKVRHRTGGACAGSSQPSGPHP